jgi:formylglycine-generating enzyme required for sulfatase activity
MFVGVPLLEGAVAWESGALSRESRQLFVERTEVSNREFKSFRPEHKTSYEDVAAEEAPDAPVGAVTPDDARRFAEWVTLRDPAHEYRLPSEGEWEAFCRAGSPGEHGWWGDSDAEFVRFANVRDRAWLRAHDYAPRIFNADDGFPGVAPIGSLEPNPWGLYDTLGNVWEICDTDDPQPASDEAVWRGGSYADGPGIGPWSRGAYIPQPPNVGFRLVAVERRRQP